MSQDTNSTLIPESTVTGKTAIVKSGSREAKSQIQIDIESGMSYADAEAKHGVPAGTIRQRAKRGNWLTPRTIARVTRAVTKQMMPVVAGAIMQESIDKHVANTFKIASESCAKFKAKAPRNFKDLDTADKIARRAANLENDDDGAHASILLLNESIERAGVAVEPIEAHATLQPGSLTSESGEQGSRESGEQGSNAAAQEAELVDAPSVG